MHCPFCSAVDTKVIDSRLVGEGTSVRRRRQCLVCNERFTTFEVAELVMPRVVKSNDVREPFNEDKLRSGLMKALERESRTNAPGDVLVVLCVQALVGSI